jgi:hypothetical protein
MSDQVFEGTFEPPMLGSTSTPIPLAGKGSVAITGEALVVKGFRGGGAAIALATFLVVTAAALGGAYLVLTLLFHRGLSSGAVGGAIAAGIASAAAMPKRSSQKPWDLVIPWSSVKKAVVNLARKDVQITIKQHRPKGTLHFKPTDGATQRVVDAIVARLG